MMTKHLQIARAIADRYSQLPIVEAVAIAGSITSGYASAGSDVDVYIYPTEDIPAEVCLSIAREFAEDAAYNDYWGANLAWLDAASGVEVDVMFFSTSWMEDQVRGNVEHHRAKTGYSTSFWHTIKVSQALFDRSGWLTRMQTLANRPYPPELAHAIVSLNYPLLREIRFSYRAQIAKALKRSDQVLVMAKTNDLLVSYFDILFALNHLPHPGEKRMLTTLEDKASLLPINMRQDVTYLVERAAAISEDTLPAVDTLVDHLTDLLKD
ncbi:MAG: DUF4037 domain-containing protein, partial [Anaerolineae bacterium]|nr:DUF4037 domain-containing protein [Anaerolineae bacterium]